MAKNGISIYKVTVLYQDGYEIKQLSFTDSYSCVLTAISSVIKKCKELDLEVDKHSISKIELINTYETIEQATKGYWRGEWGINPAVLN